MTAERCVCGHLRVLHVRSAAECAACTDDGWCDCTEYRETTA